MTAINYSMGQARRITLRRAVWLWLRQGRPRHMPIVVIPGRCIVIDNGAMTLMGWTFASGFMRETLDLSPGSEDALRLWEYLIEHKFAQVEWMGVDQWREMTRARQT